MAKHIECRQVVKDCTFTAVAATEAELVQKVVAHAAHDHGIVHITPEIAEKVKAAIVDRPEVD